MICPNCKKELADNALTCPECGYSFFMKMQKKGCGCTIALLVGLVIIVGLVIYSVVS